MQSIYRLLSAFVLVMSFTANANIIHFDLRAQEIEELDGVAQFTYSLSGVAASIAANVGVLNRTGSGFGIDIVGSGCDNSDAIDRSCAGPDGEKISVWFDQRVELVSMQISGLTGGDIALWQLPDFTSLFYSSAGVYEPDTALFLNPGERFSLGSWADNTTKTQRGFSFDGFTVELVKVAPEAVNEPTSMLFVCVGLLVILFRGRRSPKLLCGNLREI